MRLPNAAMLLGLLAASCANPPPAEPPPAAPIRELHHPLAPSATASAPTPSSSTRVLSGAPEYPPTPPALLARLDADQRTELAVLATLCQPAVAERKGNPITGCTACPSNSAPASEPGARLVPEDAIIVPQAHVRGAFTAKGADEHLVMMNSCSCNGCFDEAYVVRAGADGTFRLHRLANVRAAYDCKVVRRRGQVDRALCDRTLARMGYVAKVVELYDFSSLPADEKQELTPSFEFTALDDLALRCAPTAHFVRRYLQRWELRDVDRDGEEDLVIDVDVGDGVVSKEVLAACSQEDDSAPPKGHLPPMRGLELTWTATPTGFKPTAATAGHLKRLEAAKKKEDE
ncbi:Hypothetical protein A7982_01345 [Minicystis rosea]|nr:Hypothetical protein A7982_01345 [Minicystis rosea]